MTQVVLSKCPRCQNELRIPAEWLNRSMRCKHCQMVFQAKANGVKPVAVPASAPVQPAAVVTPRAKPAPPVAQPVMPPPVVAVATPIQPAGPGGTAPHAVGTMTQTPIATAVQAPSLEPPLLIQANGYGASARYRRQSGGRGLLVFAILGILFLMVVGVAGTAGVIYWASTRPKSPGLGNPLAGPSGLLGNGEGTSTENTLNSGGIDLPSARGPFPRRILAINVCNYLYANPVNYGSRGRSIHQVVDRMGRTLKVPPDQVFELTDSLPLPKEGVKVGQGGLKARPVVKSVIEDAIRDFAETSRAQDRIILLFVGHAVELDDAAYLVPLEGDLADKESLIPLSWVYEQLKNCKARQKVLILDVCRYDPGRGTERPGSEPMGEKLDALLKEPPEGVQVWSACVAKQNSLELENGIIYGGAFLQTLYYALAPEQLKGIQRPTDPLPLEALADNVLARTQKLAKDHAAVEQTPRLTGKANEDGAAYDTMETVAARITLKKPPEPEGGRAGYALVKSIMDDTENLIPPVKMIGDGNDRLKPEALPPFPAKLLEEYKADEMKTPMREAILKAIEVLKNTAPKFEDRFRPPSGNDAEFKKQITDIQKNPATSPGLAQLQLEEAMKELEAAGKERDKDPSKRWQANYDYVLARMKARIAYVYEYNFMLGSMKRELPPRDPAIHQGWRLASQEKLQSGREARELANDAKKILEKLAEDHKKTPYEVLAKREMMTTLGLQWQATSFGGE